MKVLYLVSISPSLPPELSVGKGAGGSCCLGLAWLELEVGGRVEWNTLALQPPPPQLPWLGYWGDPGWAHKVRGASFPHPPPRLLNSGNSSWRG